MGAQNRVIAGDYKGCGVLKIGYSLEMYIKFGKTMPLTTENMESYEIVEKDKGQPGGSATFVDMEGNVLVGTTSGTKDVYTVALNFKDGKRSLAEIDGKRYIILRDMFFEASAKPEVKEPEATISPADELMKWKSLLDQGVITAEEFEAKKKQLLGL